MNDSIRPGPPPVPPQPEDDPPKMILVPKVPTPWEYTHQHIEGAKKAANNILDFVAKAFIVAVALAAICLVISIIFMAMRPPH